ncbi:MAG: diheme cytochrome c-553 [Bacteroidia bacterium]|nr:diheme cytochrome c-553 [Bacteroidia bacterium]MBP7728590.1 diheme cytochrome c-553 [Bacteroidia bacterium]
MTSHKTLSLLVIAAALAGAIACSSPAPEGEKKNTETVDENAKVERGRYLVGIMGCDDCHSPKVMGPMGPEPDTSRRLSGHPADMPLGPSDTNVFANGWVLMSMQLTTTHGPWGKTYAANLTSDETGIGNWSYEQFKKAMTEGKYKGMDNTRPLMPPMPWPNFRNLHEDDLQAIFAFLKSTKPVKNRVPDYAPPGS